MPAITLPDGSVKAFDHPVTTREIAESIGRKLAKDAIVGRVDGELIDLDRPIEHDAYVEIVTSNDPDGLEVIRHSTAHLMAQAVKQLHPEMQVTIGPTVDNGFYYDFAGERSLSEDELETIEQRMSELAEADHPVEREVWDREAARQFFLEQGETYKAQIIDDLPESETITVYRQGDFADLCRGPHVPSTGKLKAFKLTKVAGAYWRGDQNNEMLQRVYGTAWPDRKQLKAYLDRLAEAERRDHRRLGRTQDLFHVQEESPGMVFWHPRGWRLYLEVQDYIRRLMRDNGYQEIHTPMLVDRSLWERSGHWAMFAENMFVTESESRDYAVKPMNCPCHVEVFKQGLKSYRDLPLRLAEFGSCHRNEPSGTLHGLMRVRGFVQDDAHIFCTENQIQEEVRTFIDLVYRAYRDFGFEDVLIALSTRPDERVGDDALWDKAESALATALETHGLDYTLQPGEGAFYGPKIEFSLRDCLERVWQLGTIQVDFSMPGRLGAQFVDDDGERRTPVMLHRAILGSLERFIGILIEHYGGALPTWLAPVQAVVLNITDRQADYARSVEQQLLESGFRAEADLRNEKIGYKIREHTLQKVPYMLVLGDRELESGTVAVRHRDGTDLGSMELEELVARLSNDIAGHEREQED
ncbi:threonine--tRNA ligase [Halorhodospira halophila]|uniref:Threonine--tRNA ligase n=1 Tax=Halorhodospira halophila (strain DSM 244 / SL1) TaxID=349124 RepID=SYT_HALHL|nr:threonine--tRNA ligase [Halorhodospira halophila]A1WU53.1 RecName: Full=Threonine--tRNA ligase; AltName: Full=Threonyl-tRNA synthetase; Short=ThrRS [Halorhodospira halophila SL1]ABM61215.1 threonyl-tRNA synthetase / Ser-tRNA(Thr) hydrolase [Halorhodospira halophila SL1]MBK1730053.1 threonine--tRNA ligase [Halorhodospira halophila]